MEASRAVSADSVTGLTGQERVRGFELAAGLSVLFMILVHVLWHWGRPETWTTPIGELISFAAGPTAAPVFVFLMGVTIGAGPRTHTLNLVARGAWLVVLGYALNFLRGVIPAALGEAAGVITAEQVWPYDTWWLATTVDLHHVVGLSLASMALLRTRLEPGPGWIAVAAAVVLLSPWLRTVEFGTPILDAPLTPVLGSAPNVYYALVPWVVYALGGAVFGAAMTRAAAANRPALFRRGAIVGTALLAIGGVLIVLTRPGFDVFTYWRQPLAFPVAITGLILVWLAVCDAVTRRPAIDSRLGVVYGWSRRIIAMYFAHWLLVGWGVGLVGFRALGLAEVLLAMIAAVVVTSHLSRYVVYLETSWWQRRAPERAPASMA